MTAIDAYAASRPRPTLPPEYSANPGFIGTQFVHMLHDDRRGFVWTRDCIGAYLVMRAGGDAEANH